MGAKRVRRQSIRTQEALNLLSSQIKAARRKRRLTESGLAERIFASRSTVQKIEKGDPKVEIGLVLEAATVLGVPLFTHHARAGGMELHQKHYSEVLALLPKRGVRHA